MALRDCCTARNTSTYHMGDNRDRTLICRGGSPAYNKHGATSCKWVSVPTITRLCPVPKNCTTWHGSHVSIHEGFLFVQGMPPMASWTIWCKHVRPTSCRLGLQCKGWHHQLCIRGTDFHQPAPASCANKRTPGGGGGSQYATTAVCMNAKHA